LAHLALEAAEIAALAAGEKCFLTLFAGFGAAALPCAAILFATPARMLAIPFALSLRFLGSNNGDAALIFAHLAF